MAVLTELMQRIFLTLLRFEGERCSYLNGSKWEHFPPKELTASEP
jgi:hypothetical protein